MGAQHLKAAMEAGLCLPPHLFPTRAEVAMTYEVSLPIEEDEEAVCDYCEDEPDAAHCVTLPGVVHIFLCACCYSITILSDAIVRDSV